MTSRDELLEALAEENPEALTADGFEDAFLGIQRRFGATALAAYDYEKCLTVLQERDGMTRDSAIEFFDFNVIGSWVGDGTPVFIERAEPRAEQRARDWCHTHPDRYIRLRARSPRSEIGWVATAVRENGSTLIDSGRTIYDAVAAALPQKEGAP